MKTSTTLLLPLTIALALLTGCADEGGEDSGVAQCRVIAANLARTEQAAPPTKDQIATLRDAFDDSDFPELRAAGINYADAAEDLFYGTGKNKGNAADALQRQSLLGEACRGRGVVIPDPLRPTMSPPTLPEMSLPPMPDFTPIPTLPAN